MSGRGDLCLLGCAIIALVVYDVLAIIHTPFLAFCWLLAIPLYIALRFGVR